jgi:hypothetical protein
MLAVCIPWVLSITAPGPIAPGSTPVSPILLLVLLVIANGATPVAAVIPAVVPATAAAVVATELLTVTSPACPRRVACKHVLAIVVVVDIAGDVLVQLCAVGLPQELLRLHV